MTSATVEPFLRGWMVFVFDAFICVEDELYEVVMDVLVPTVLVKGDVDGGSFIAREYPFLLVGVKAAQ